MPLPLREFYPIARATELLECTVDDLIHWAMIGCIGFYIKFDYAEGEVCITDSYRNFDISNILDKTSYAENKKIVKYFSSVEKDVDDEDDIDENEYFFLKYRVLESYVHNHGGQESLDKLGLREAYAELQYLFTGHVSEDLCAITSTEYLSTVIRRQSSEQSIYGTYSDPVQIQGFFRLQSDNFYHFSFSKKFKFDEEGVYTNTVSMPECDLSVYLTINETVEFDIDDLYILKKDFLKILDASTSGCDMTKVYPYQHVSSSHSWWKGWVHTESENQEDTENNKNERVSAKSRHAMKILISKCYPEIKDNPSKLADVLTAEAKALGLEALTFDKATVSRWIKG